MSQVPSVACSNLDVFGKELAGDEELTGEELAECMNFKRRSWNGVLPVNFLSQWASDRQVSCNTAASVAEYPSSAHTTDPMS